MESFLELCASCEEHQIDEFKGRFRRFKTKGDQSEDAYERFYADAIDILEQSRESLIPYLECWISNTSYEEFERGLANYRQGASENQIITYNDNSNGYGSGNTSNNRIVSDKQGKPLVTTSKSYNLFIGDLPLQTTENDLRNAYSQFGTITKVRILQKGQKQLAFGFIHFAECKSLQRALKEQPTVVINGKNCRCGSSQERVTLYFANIPLQASQKDLLNWLESSVGTDTVVSVEIKYGPPPDFVSRRFGFVQFVDQSTAEMAKRKFSSEPQKFFGEILTIDNADNNNSDEGALMQVKTMFLSNVAEDVSEGQIRQLCDKYGNVFKVSNVRRDRGFVYVEYVMRDDCLKAIDAIHNTKLGSKYISATLAKPQTTKDPRIDPRGIRGGRGGPVPFGFRGGRGRGRGGMDRSAPYDIRGRRSEREDKKPYGSRYSARGGV
eukprot:Awhi_evm1s12673